MPVSGDTGCGDPLQAPPGGMSLMPGWMAVGGGGAGVFFDCACATIGCLDVAVRGFGVLVGADVLSDCACAIIGCVGVAVGGFCVLVGACVA
ncbi:MAG: hypothetical protein F4Y44_05480, partial [Chloroflexi bacterium]|nr:hypothetical protein [Chloroflexota bacterium]